MKYLILVIIILSFGCRTKETINKNISKGDTVLVDEDQYTFSKTYRILNDTYPFNKSDTIELVSYDTRRGRLNENLINNGQFAVSNIRQRIVLNQKETKRLFSILYDSDKIGGQNVGPGADCYNPHHSVVFYERGQAIAFLEICFDCEGTKQTADVDFGEFTDEKWCTLQKFFKTNKADFAIINERCP